MLRRVAVDGREKLAELGEGDEARSWATGLSYPLWLVKRVRADIGLEAARRLLEAGNAAPERCLRANRLRGGLPAARRAMAAEGFKTRGVDGLPDALLYEGPPLERSGVFRDGLVTPQSRGSQIAATVAAGGVAGPGAQVLDLCAAPGAKTSQLAALLPEARITAVEVDEARAGELRANLARLGADDVNVVRARRPRAPGGLGRRSTTCCSTPRAAAWARSRRAPTCAGAGTPPTCRASPDLQARLLARAAAAVKPGGALTYAVCTMTRAETLGVVETAARRRRLDGRRPRRRLARACASGLRRLPARAAARRWFDRLLRRPPAPGRCGGDRPLGAAG